MAKKFYTIIVIGLCILLIGANVTLALTANQDLNNIKMNTIKTVPTITMENWSDNFDSYENNQFLDGTPDDGGWKGWDNNSDAGAYVVDDQALSTPYSVEISDATDLVHEYSGYTSGTWTYTAMQYIPTDMIGQSYFIMLNTYADGGPYHWSVQVQFDSTSGKVISEPENLETDIVYDQWVEIRVEIDLGQDTQAIYYNDELLSEKSWSEGVSGPGGAINIAAVDLYAQGATEIYYDDISLIGEPGGGPTLEIQIISGGFGVSAVIANTGDGDATDVEWSITLDGGLVILGKESSGTIATIAAGETADIKSSLIFGIGSPTITVTADCTGSSAEGTASGFVFLFFVLGVS